MKKRAIGMGIVVGIPAIIGVTILSGISGAILLAVALAVGLGWVGWRANSEKTGPATPP